MFEDLDEQIKHDDLATISPKEKFLKWTIAAIVSLLVIVGLYLISLTW
jgi:hypothetical protein